MARRGSTRRNRSLSLVSRLYSPFGHLFKATGNSARAVSRGVGNVAGTVVNTANRVGKTVAREANQTISNVTRARKGHGRRGTRKSRRSSRR